MGIVEACRDLKRAAGIVDPHRPLLPDLNDEPWNAHSINSAWRRDLKNLGLDSHEPRLTFKGLRATNATLLADAAMSGGESANDVLARVQAMLGHHSKAMSAQYARRAQIRHTNADSVGLLPDFGNKRLGTGNTSEKD